MSTNALGLQRSDYTGLKSTLCTGCGHDSVTNHIISALFQTNVSPYQVAKMSGIGCSSKTPAYFLSRSHGFNAIHGRMAPVATGVKVVNPELTLLGVSGDGDTASIGLGSFAHMIRRNLPMLYIVENNGVYGLTKGQFSATADPGSTVKSGEANPFQTIDLCSLAMDLGCSFVARSFSGDAKQLVPLLSAALHHQGTAFIDVISPCVTFANNEGSTKSYNYVRTQLQALQELGFVQSQEAVQVDYSEGTTETIELSDGSFLTLKKIDSKSHDIKDASHASQLLREARQQGQILTGLFYLNTEPPTLINQLKLGPRPLAHLQEEELRPSPQVLEDILNDFA